MANKVEINKVENLSSNISKFVNLYKSGGEDFQEKRRKFLLTQQKAKRAEAADDSRGIKEFVNNLRKKEKRKSKPNKTKYENYYELQLSEWMKEKPEDLDRWLLVPCPKGQRCLIIANEGHTKMYNKSGRFAWRFNSMLPGDGVSRQNITILDCIFVPHLKTYFILDLIAYGNQEVVNCDTQFRFFWIKSKLQEDSIMEVSGRNEYSFKLIDFYDFEDENEIYSCLYRFPYWENNTPEIDGFLFYHKDASYTHGVTPLVGWIFPYMIPEILNIPVNPNYEREKPSDYFNALHYMMDFDKALLNNKHRRRRKQNGDKMDEDILSEEIEDVMNCQRELELNGSSSEMESSSFS